MKRLLPLVLALALVAAGCGEDEEGGSEAQSVTVTETVATDQPITKAEYIARADALCAEASSKLDPLNQELDDLTANDTDLERGAEIMRESQAIVEPLAAQFKALPLPEDSAAVEEYLRLLDQSVALLPQLEDAFADRDTDTLETLGQRSEQLGAQQESVGKIYGFQECGLD